MFLTGLFVLFSSLYHTFFSSNQVLILKIAFHQNIASLLSLTISFANKQLHHLLVVSLNFKVQLHYSLFNSKFNLWQRIGVVVNLSAVFVVQSQPPLLVANYQLCVLVLFFVSFYFALPTN